MVFSKLHERKNFCYEKYVSRAQAEIIKNVSFDIAERRTKNILTNALISFILF